MKKVVVGMVMVLVAGVSFGVGRWVENAKSGYHYEVIEEKKIEGAAGEVYWRNVGEWVGRPILVTNTTEIEVDKRLVYKARRVFQEGFPVARNVRVNETGGIEWEDGEYGYELKMKRMGPTTRTGE